MSLLSTFAAAVDAYVVIGLVLAASWTAQVMRQGEIDGPGELLTFWCATALIWPGVLAQSFDGDGPWRG